MRKIEGLKFLQQFFPEVSVDCVFVEQDEVLDIRMVRDHTDIFRVRCGSKIGSEMKLPQRTCGSVREIQDFILSEQARDGNSEFVIHRVNASYFSPIYVGTIALFSYPDPLMVIDYQAVTKKLVAGIDTGLRPRDWEIVASYDYQYQSGRPEIRYVSDIFHPESLKFSIYQLWRLGREIDDKRQAVDGYSTRSVESLIRFNIYQSGDVLLDDYRDVTSFAQAR